jgi:hypothetical protein
MLASSDMRQEFRKQHQTVIEPAVAHGRIEPTIRDLSVRKAPDTVGYSLVEQLAVQVACEATESLQRFK